MDAASARIVNRAGLESRTNGGSVLAEKERIVRSADSSIIEITSASRPVNSAHAWAVLRSRSKSSISAICRTSLPVLER